MSDKQYNKNNVNTFRLAAKLLLIFYTDDWKIKAFLFCPLLITIIMNLICTANIFGPILDTDIVFFPLQEHDKIDTKIKNVKQVEI